MTTPSADRDDVRRENLEMLREQYWAATAAPAASAIVDSVYGDTTKTLAHGFIVPPDPVGAAAAVFIKGTLELAQSTLRRRRIGVLLRDHREQGIDDANEVRLRDAFDQLLSFYSLTEIACLIGEASDDFTPEFRDRAKRDLNQPAVSAYFRKHYPLLLPRYFRERVLGTKHRRIELEARTAALFPAFMDISAKLEHDEKVETFLWFLDSGTWGGYNLEDLLDAARKPKVFLQRLSAKVDEKRGDRLDMAVQGMRTFLIFCQEFDDLLSACAEAPAFQSAMWHYHAYWFDHLREEVGRTLNDVLNCLGSWTEATTAGGSGQEDTRALREAIARLTSTKYSKALKAL